MNHAFDYCKTPHKVTKKELINALHQIYLQFKTVEKMLKPACYNNKPSFESVEKCLEKAGHIGFTN